MKRVSKDRMPHYRNRADAFFATMRLVHGDPLHTASVGLLAVHAAIAFGDTVLVGLTGARPSDQQHLEAAKMLQQLCALQRRASGGIAHFKKLLNNKSDFTYGERTIRPDEIESAYVAAERFANWVFTEFPEIARPQMKGG